jgi:hypothetical protein
MSQNGKMEHKKHKGKISQYGKEVARNRLEICHRWTKCHKAGKEAGHDVTSDKMSTLRQR